MRPKGINMRYTRTVEERLAAVERLEQNKKKRHRYNCFGEDNRERVDIMIDVIKNERSPEWIDKTYPSCNELGKEDIKKHDKWVAAIIARDFLMGKEGMKSLLYPEY